MSLSCVEASIADATPTPCTTLVSVHACGDLSDLVLKLAAEAQVARRGGSVLPPGIGFGSSVRGAIKRGCRGYERRRGYGRFGAFADLPERRDGRGASGAASQSWVSRARADDTAGDHAEEPGHRRRGGGGDGA